MFADVKHLMHYKRGEGRSALAQQLHFEMLKRVLARDAAKQFGSPDRLLAGVTGAARLEPGHPIAPSVLEVFQKAAVILYGFA
ncbi:MAG: hypothetical protein AAB280_10505 [Pseudomonadota bacterium]